MAFKYTALNSIIGESQYGNVNAHVHDLDAVFRNPPGSIGHIVTTLGTTNVLVQKSGTYKVFILGAGGAGSAMSSGDYAGDGGFFSAEIPFVAGDVLEIGVGQGGLSTGGQSAQITGGTYVMRGGGGFQGRGYWAGDGGGGSYIKVTNGAATSNHQDYVIIAGGGGGNGNHSHQGNWGGFGFGVGGGSWNAEYGGRTSSSSSTGGAGYNGYDGSGGGGGYPRSTVNAWNYGGSANVLNQYHGGRGGGPVSTASDYSGGGGGGGAGGGGGSGSGGTATNNIGGSAVAGGYLSTTTTVSGFTAEIVPMGGGGGGGHTNDCAATGGGGGALLFTAHNTSWGSVMGVDIPYHGSTQRTTDFQLNAISEYNAYDELSTYSTTYFGYNMTTTAPASGGIQGLGYGGAQNSNGTDGCVIIANINETITPTIL